MKIGIVTYWTATDNYGQLLQCYALQHYLRMHGHDAYLIRYNPNGYISLKQRIKSVVKPALALAWPKVRKSLQTTEAWKQSDARNKVRDFDGFRQRYLYSTERVYNRWEELVKNPPQADCYMTGSDQVWSGDITQRYVWPWYLRFGGPEVRRIAYAASMGRHLESNVAPLFKEMVKDFQALGVREASLREECERYGILGVKLTADPTLLLKKEDYPISEVRTEKPYMLLYVLNVNTAEEFYWNAIEAFIKKRRLDSRMVYSSGSIPAWQVIPNQPGELLTIPDWLAAVRDAKCVMTTSFHGTVFSIIMHRPFLSVLLKGRLSIGNARITDLLTMLGLESRIYNPQKDLAEQMESPIDWARVDEVLDELRKDSKNFLTKSLTC